MVYKINWQGTLSDMIWGMKESNKSCLISSTLSLTIGAIH